MSTPLATLLHGSLTIEPGYDVDSFGSGDITVHNNVYVNGTANSTAAANGALVVGTGGLGVAANTFLGGTLNVSSTSNLQTTNIDTTLGGLNVSGGNAVNVNVSMASNIVSFGTLTLNSSGGNAILQSGLNANNAVQLVAQNAAGGVDILSGQTGQVTITGGSGGIQESTSAGSINLTANGATGSFQVNSSAANQTLTLAVNGATDSAINIFSAGTSATQDAIKIFASTSTGNILIANNTIGSGSITNYAGSTGYFVTTNTGGPVSLISNGANSNFTVNSIGAGSTLTVGATGEFTGTQLILQSAGTNGTSAVLIRTTSTVGGIQLSNPSGSSGGIQFDSGSGGIDGTTQDGGAIQFLAVGAASYLKNQTNANGQHLTIGVESTGSTFASHLILLNQAGGNINVSTLSGGNLSASISGQVNINSSDSTNGINIGTLQNTPVRIGTNTSTTTIYGNLDVQGTTTTIESTTVQIVDNIIELNNGPTGTADSGIAVKRYQGWEDGTLVGPVCTGIVGDVVADVADNFNLGAYNVVGAGSTSTILALDAVDPNFGTPGFYNGWWVKILPDDTLTFTTGACQVRRIKNHTGPTAVLYGTADEASSPNVPPQGRDFTTTPVAGTLYALYPCHWIMSIWDALNKEWAIVCSPMDTVTATPPIAHYVDLHINNLTANAITANTINGTTADVQGTINLTDNSTAGVNLTLPGSINYGIYMIMIRPTTAATNRPSAVFTIGRINAATAGQVSRLIAVKGSGNSNLDIDWNASALPQIKYRPSPGVAGTTNYTYKITTV